MIWGSKEFTASCGCETVLNIQAEIVKSIQLGLSKSHLLTVNVGTEKWATGTKSHKLVKMSYANYDKSIVATHKCKIISWVGQLQNPSNVDTLDELQKLCDAWASGDARWTRLTGPQVKAHMAEIKASLE